MVFESLTDPELAALRRLFAAASTFAPDLVVGDGLALITAAETEARSRALRPSARLHVCTPGLDPATLAHHLECAAAGLPVSITSTTKWSPVVRLIAAALSIDDDQVYVTSVGGLSRNLTVRLTQSHRARAAAIAAVVWSGADEPLAKALAALQRACLQTPRLTLLFTLAQERFTLAAVAAPPAVPVPKVLLAAYPSALILPNPESDVEHLQHP